MHGYSTKRRDIHVFIPLLNILRKSPSKSEREMFLPKLACYASHMIMAVFCWEFNSISLPWECLDENDRHSTLHSQTFSLTMPPKTVHQHCESLERGFIFFSSHQRHTYISMHRASEAIEAIVLRSTSKQRCHSQRNLMLVQKLYFFQFGINMIKVA